MKCQKNRVKARFWNIFLASVALLFSHVALAHNKVVVIPLAGEDVVETIEPFMPITDNSPANSNYIITANTVIDKLTKLEWQRIHSQISQGWTEAASLCSQLIIDGKSDWRLPDIHELQSIVDYGTNRIAKINPVAFPNMTSSVFWSVSIAANSIWGVDFGSGEMKKVRTFGFTGDRSQYRCVR